MGRVLQDEFGQPSITWPESVDEALCFGWIDGVRNSLERDELHDPLHPAQAGSIWSAVNIRKVQALIKEGRMRPAGLEAFAARRDNRSGIWIRLRTARRRTCPSPYDCRAPGQPARPRVLRRLSRPPTESSPAGSSSVLNKRRHAAGGSRNSSRPALPASGSDCSRDQPCPHPTALKRSRYTRVCSNSGTGVTHWPLQHCLRPMATPLASTARR